MSTWVMQMRKKFEKLKQNKMNANSTKSVSPKGIVKLRAQFYETTFISDKTPSVYSNCEKSPKKSEFENSSFERQNYKSKVSNLGKRPSDIVNEDNICIYSDPESDSLYGSFRKQSLYLKSYDHWKLFDDSWSNNTIPQREEKSILLNKVSESDFNLHISNSSDESLREKVNSSNHYKTSENDIILRLKTGEREFQNIKRYESILRPPLFQQIMVSKRQKDNFEDKPRKSSIVAGLIDAFNRQKISNNYQETLYEQDLVDSIYKEEKSPNACKNPGKICQELKANRNLKWIETEQVQSKGLAKNMKKEDIKFQESQFEIISSEASYNRSLSVLVDKFYNAPQMSLVETNEIKPIIKPYQKEHLFSNILKIYSTSSKFLADLEKRFCESAKITDLSDIVIKYAAEEFDVYVPYIQNQRFQSEAYNELKKDIVTAKIIEELESQPECCLLSLDSFLLLPMQRLLRILLLLKAVKTNTQPQQKRVMESVEKAIHYIEKIIQRCSENKNYIDERQRMMQIIRYLDFKQGQQIRELGKLIHEGEVKRSTKNPSKRFMSEFLKFKEFWFILTSKYLLMTKLSKGKELSYAVDDYCPLSELFVEYESIEENASTFGFKLQITRKSNVCDVYFIQTKTKDEHKKWTNLLSNS